VPVDAPLAWRGKAYYTTLEKEGQSVGSGIREFDGWRAVLAVFGFALAFHVSIALLAARASDIPLSHLGVYFDGHVYIEIAKSFPLPFAAEGRHYLGHAPGYPAAIAGVRALTPPYLVNWGLAALLASWTAAALSAAAFFVLCRAVGCAPLWPSLLFVVANPSWLVIGSTAHAESLAMLLSILAFVACFRNRLAASAGALSFATLARFPAVLAGPALAWGFLVTRRRRDWRTWLALAAPLAALALLQLYLFARIPGFLSVLESHRVFWDARLGIPFGFLFELPALRANGLPPTLVLTLATLLVYVSAVAIGFRPGERERWVLPLWVAGILLFHASLSGEVAFRAFTRLAVLAWPGALLVFWRWIGVKLPPAVAAGVCLVLALSSLSYARAQIEGAVIGQARVQTFLRDEIRLLDHDQPHWVDFASRVRNPPPPP
jgi:hypothetical protein